VVAVSAGVVKSGLDISDVPPLGTLNQSNVPVLAEACNWAVLPEHMVSFDAVGTDGEGVTVAVTGVRALKHPFTLTTT
jgi:hypothetical protein